VKKTTKRTKKRKTTKIKHCKKCGDGRLVTTVVHGRKLTFCGFCGAEFK